MRAEKGGSGSEQDIISTIRRWRMKPSDEISAIQWMNRYKAAMKAPRD
jgi:hypothetical protein